MDFITVFDDAIVRALNQFATKSPVFDSVVFDVADASILQAGLFMAYFWWAWFRSDGEVARRRQDIVVSVFGAILAVFVARVLQLALPFHNRPLHTPDLHFVLPTGVNPETLSAWNSLPSDHAVLLFALSTAVWHLSPRAGRLAMAWSLVIGCLPRIYLGYHFPSDVISGALCGIVLMNAIWYLTPREKFVQHVVGWQVSHRMAFYAVAFVLTYELAVLFFDVRHLLRDGYDIAKAVVNLRA